MKGALLILAVAVLAAACTSAPAAELQISTTSTTLAPVTTLPPTTTTTLPPTTTTTTKPPEPPELTVSVPADDIVETYIQIVEGETDPTATLTINDEPVDVARDGTFAAELINDIGENTIVVAAESEEGLTTTETISYTFEPPKRWAEAIGDSVMLGTKPEIELRLDNVHVDATVSRQFNKAPGLVRGFANREVPPEVIIVGLGTNGPAREKDFDAVMEYAKDIPIVVFVNVSMPRSWEATSNKVIEDGVARYENAYLADWYHDSNGHPNLFAKDGVHPKQAGRVIIAELISDQIFPNWIPLDQQQEEPPDGDES